MAVHLKMNNNTKRGVLSRLTTLINPHSQRFCSHVPEEPVQDQLSPMTGSRFRGRIKISKLKILDGESLGITTHMIPDSSWFILKNLRRKGYKSYLVGGCVRDLLLKRTPKDFDIITIAKLEKVKMLFRGAGGAQVVGRKFPICLIHRNGSVVEVSSFATVSKTSKGMEQFFKSMLPECSNEEGTFLRKNSLQRDFTINSLFYDPFTNKIYDYANGMADLRSLKLETVIPAQLSFEEDPGRILRGFRIAARLGLSLSKETEAAIRTCSPLVMYLNKQKIMIELNYMLSYGAAEPSLHLLWKFKLLEFLLPLHAAYLDEQAAKEDAQASNMLMKLFFHLDNLVGCGRPSESTLWIGLLAFHLALVNNPQDALVVRALASVLYHGEWEEGIKFAKEHAGICVNFAPEIKSSSIYKSDEEIAKEVTKLAVLVMGSIPALVEDSGLLQSLSEKYPHFPRSGMVFIPKKTGRIVAAIFNTKLHKNKKKGSKINYNKLKSGDISEIRFVLGKIVLETMSSGIVGDGDDFEAQHCHLKTEAPKEIRQLSELVNHQLVAKKGERQVLSAPNPERRQWKIKKQKLVDNGCTAGQKIGSGNQELFEEFEYKKTHEERRKLVKLRQKVDLSTTKDSLVERKNSHRKQLINDSKKIASTGESSLDHQATDSKMEEHNTRTPSQSTLSKTDEVIGNNCNVDTTNESGLKKRKKHLSVDEVSNKKERQKSQKSEGSLPPLSSLFK